MTQFKIESEIFFLKIFFQNNQRWGKLMFRNHQVMCIYTSLRTLFGKKYDPDELIPGLITRVEHSGLVRSCKVR